MQIALPSNPKTTGWARRIAVALLLAFATCMVGLPLGFFLFLARFNTAYPNGTQNLLSAITAAMVVSVSLAALVLAVSLVVSFFLPRSPAAPSR